MRSPWKFLADLASRQPKDKPPVETPEAVPAVTSADASEDKLKDKAEKPAAREVEDGLAARVPDAPTDKADPADVKDVPQPVRRKSSTAKVGKLRAQPRDAVAAQVELDVAPIAGETDAAPPTAAKQKGPLRAKSRSGATKAGNAATNESEAAIQRPSSRDPFVVEMESLDEDVRKLKLLLAEKLKMQNEHLRTLLKRFDRP